MKRHLVGFLVFVVIIGVTITIYAIGRSLVQSFDAAALPPIVESHVEPTRPSTPIFAGKDYVARFAQYDSETRKLTARLEVEPSDIENRSIVEVIVAVEGSESNFRGLQFQAVGKVLRGQGRKAVILVEQTVPDRLIVNADTNHYAAFRIANEESLEGRTANDFGSKVPILFVHDRTPSTRGPVILQ